MPNAPAFLQPVSVAKLQKNEPLLLYSKRELDGREEANRRIINMRSWYNRLRQEYSTAKN